MQTCDADVLRLGPARTLPPAALLIGLISSDLAKIMQQALPLVNKTGGHCDPVSTAPV